MIGGALSVLLALSFLVLPLVSSLKTRPLLNEIRVVEVNPSFMYL